MKQKLKTHKGTAKRVKVTGSGLKHRSTNRRHNLSTKNAKRKRHLSANKSIDANNQDRIERLLQLK